MKFGPITKLDKRNKTSGKFDDKIMLENCDVNLEQSRSRVLEASSVKLMLSVAVTFYLKTELKNL